MMHHPLPHHSWVGFVGPWVLLLGLAVLGPGCKEKPPKLTDSECETFCRRLVPCFASQMENYAQQQDADTKQCIADCKGREGGGERRGQILKAMKKCGELTDCGKLRECFQGAL
jgi:hypothetical protein